MHFQLFLKLLLIDCEYASRSANLIHDLDAIGCSEKLLATTNVNELIPVTVSMVQDVALHFWSPRMPSLPGAKPQTMYGDLIPQYHKNFLRALASPCYFPAFNLLRS